MKSPKPPSEKGKQLNAIAKYAGFGFEMAGGILIPVLIGHKIDQRMGNSDVPVFTLLLAAVGLFYVFYRLYKFSSN